MYNIIIVLLFIAYIINFNLLIWKENNKLKIPLGITLGIIVVCILLYNK